MVTLRVTGSGWHGPWEDDLPNSDDQLRCDAFLGVYQEDSLGGQNQEILVDLPTVGHSLHGGLVGLFERPSPEARLGHGSKHTTG